MLVTALLLLTLQLLKDSMSSEEILCEISSLYVVVGIQLGHSNIS